MKLRSGQKLLTCILTLLCILLLSLTAMAAETTDETNALENTLPEVSGPNIEIEKSSSKELTASEKEETSQKLIGPGIKKKEKPVITRPVFEEGTSLGLFSVTGYCSCSKCSGEHCVTYSGTVPQPRHTISADIAVLPLDSKVMIDGVIYTVEDIGSNVGGNKVDIFFGSHQEALDFGRQTKELFEITES